MLCRQKKKNTFTAHTSTKTVAATLFVLTILNVVNAFAAMPGASLTSNPFEVAQGALSTLIENSISLGKWLAMGASVVILLSGMIFNQFDFRKSVRIALILIAFSSLTWVVELFCK